MLNKLTEFASKAIDVGSDLGKSALSTTQELANQITETGKEKVREAQAKVNEYTSAVEKLEEIDLIVDTVLDDNVNYDEGELYNLFEKIKIILERK